MTDPVGLAAELTNYGDPDFALICGASFARSMAIGGDAGEAGDRLADTRPAFNNLPPPFPGLIEAVKRGRAGGRRIAIGVPDDLLGEVSCPDQPDVPNLMAMDTEEMIRARDGPRSCWSAAANKTVPAQLMARSSATGGNRPRRRAMRPRAGMASGSAPAPIAAALQVPRRRGDPSEITRS